MDQVKHTSFDGDWKLTVSSLDSGGSIKSAGADQISAAQLILIRDELRTTNSILREMSSGISSVRHFFHALGQERMRLIVKEKHREVDLRAKRRRRREAALKRRKR